MDEHDQDSRRDGMEDETRERSTSPDRGMDNRELAVPGAMRNMVSVLEDDNNDDSDSDEAPRPPSVPLAPPAGPVPPIQNALGADSQALLNSSHGRGSADISISGAVESVDGEGPDTDDAGAVSGEARQPQADHPPLPNHLSQATPSTHAYLGEALRGTVRPREYLEAGSIIEIPVLPLQGVILFPGESLPLRLGYGHVASYADLVRSILAGDGEADSVQRGARGSGGVGETAPAPGFGHLGIVNTSQPGGPVFHKRTVGTTAEIRWAHDGADGPEEAEGGVAVMARGRHRFRILETRGFSRGVWTCRVVVCPDICPTPLRAPIPRPCRDVSSKASNEGRTLGHRSQGRDSPRNWVMSAPRFAVILNSPAALAARAAYLLRKQRNPPGFSPSAPASSAMTGARAARRRTAHVMNSGSGRGIGSGSDDDSITLPAQGWVGIRRQRARIGEQAVVTPVASVAIIARLSGSADAQAAEASDGRERWENVRDSRPRTMSGEGEQAAHQTGDGIGRGICDTHRAGCPVVEGDDREEEDFEEGEDEDAEETNEMGGSGSLKPLDPTQYSFWLAANLPLDDFMRQNLLAQDSVVVRLRMEISHLEQARDRELRCDNCGSTVAWDKDVFALPGAEGVVGAYVNPHGYVHQTVTVREAHNVIVEGVPQSVHTWFPGYCWALLRCEFCEKHLGWQFTAISNEGGERAGGAAVRTHVGPPDFFGLRRTALVVFDEHRMG